MNASDYLDHVAQVGTAGAFSAAAAFVLFMAIRMATRLAVYSFSDKSSPLARALAAEARSCNCFMRKDSGPYKIWSDRVILLASREGRMIQEAYVEAGDKHGVTLRVDHLLTPYDRRALGKKVHMVWSALAADGEKAEIASAMRALAR